MLKFPKTQRVKNQKHRKWVATLPCAVTGEHGNSQAAHIRMGTDGGMGLKPSDQFVIPLSWKQHAEQHRVGEVKYWGAKLEAAKNLSNALYLKSGDTEYAHMLLARFRRG